MSVATRQPFLPALHDRVLLGDGAIGTALMARGVAPGFGFERLNLAEPDIVRALHADYVAAGSQVIETNTFAANRLALAQHDAADAVRAVNLAGARLAREAAGASVYVAGAIGPLGLRDGEPVPDSDRAAMLVEQVAALLDGGVDLLLFETFTDVAELEAAVRATRALTALPIVAQMAFETGGSVGGADAADVAVRLAAAGADVVGANCGHGVPAVLDAIRRMAGRGIPLSAFVNAGFPERIEGRLLYQADPAYLARRATDLAALGARLIGGCCGTGPEAIRAMASALLQADTATVRVRVSDIAPTPPSEPEPLPLPRGGILVELDPPTDANMAPVLAAGRALAQAGVDALTVADFPLASVRVDTLTVAGMLARESGLPVIPHLTGRDRNRIALQAAILGAHVQDIRALLCVTGDPVRLHQEANTSGVFDVTSVGLVRLVAEFNAGQRMAGGGRTAFAIGVALNPNVRTLSGQIDKLARKIEAGATFALTQPVYEEARLDELQQALLAAGLDIPVYLGVFPLTSARMADYLHYEVPGMRIPDAVRARLSGFADAADQRAAGLEIAHDLVERFTPRVHGLYLIAPRNRVDVLLPLVTAARAAAR